MQLHTEPARMWGTEQVCRAQGQGNMRASGLARIILKAWHSSCFIQKKLNIFLNDNALPSCVSHLLASSFLCISLVPPSPIFNFSAKLAKINYSWLVGTCIHLFLVLFIQFFLVSPTPVCHIKTRCFQGSVLLVPNLSNFTVPGPW